MTRPILTVDLDGVLAAPPLGRSNFTISRTLRRDALPPQVQRVDGGTPGLRHRLGWWLNRVRYGGRGLLPDVAEGLAALAEQRELVLLTGRSWLATEVVNAWLEHHGLVRYFSAIHTNNTRLRSAQFKLWKARELGAEEHVDDDGSIAYYLAYHGLPRVFLRDWTRNRGLPYPPQVVVVRSLPDLAARLSQPPSRDGG